LAPRTDVEDVLERFDALWRAADERPFDAAATGSEPDGAATGRAAELAEAIRAGQLRLMYQPIVLADETLFRVEALVRWQHPTRGLLRAAEFLPRAARAGLLQEVDLWVLGEALAEAATWQSVVDPPPGLAVNISDLLLTGAQSATAVIEIVERAGFPWNRLSIEITEDCFRGPGSAILPAVTEMIDRGARITLDDFGTGYTSLAELHRIPVRTVNIAAGFVANVTHDAAAAAVVRAICDMAHAMGRTATAENVETVEQFDALRRIGVDAYQGRLFAMPMPAEEVRDMIARGSLPPRPRRW
jgi:EAL domain-containing protein (putative c-di-GMP-specific phosphodiesterase class I)